MGSLSDLFLKYGNLLEEAFDLDDAGNLIEKDASKIAEADSLFHDIFVSDMGGILKELAFNPHAPQHRETPWASTEYPSWMTPAALSVLRPQQQQVSTPQTNGAASGGVGPRVVTKVRTSRPDLVHGTGEGPPATGTGPAYGMPPAGKAAPSQNTQSTGNAPLYPVTGRMSGAYGDNRPAYTGHSGPVGGHIHAGVDLAAPLGSPVNSTQGGTVLPTSGWHKGYGNTVDVLHDDGRFTRYAHLASPAVKPGDKITAGQPVGAIGPEGHVHFEVHTHYDDKNPQNNYGRTTTVDPVHYFGGLTRGQQFAAGQPAGRPQQAQAQQTQNVKVASNANTPIPDPNRPQWTPGEYPNAPIESRQEISHPERNNPGNLRVGPNDWVGKVTPQGSPFEHFDTIDNGVRARALTYNTYLNRGVNTIDKISNTSGPASDGNNIASQNMAYRQALGGEYMKPGGEHLPIDPTPENIRRLTAGGISIEAGGGGKWLPKGVNMGVIDNTIGGLHSQGHFNSPSSTPSPPANVAQAAPSGQTPLQGVPGALASTKTAATAPPPSTPAAPTPAAPTDTQASSSVPTSQPPPRQMATAAIPPSSPDAKFIETRSRTAIQLLRG